MQVPPSWFVKASATWGECLIYRGGGSGGNKLSWGGKGGGGGGGGEGERKSII